MIHQQIVKQKAYALITRGNQLLVFSEPDFPEVPIQIPGGTLEDGESPEIGVMREAEEETGLTALKFVAYLGFSDRTSIDNGVEKIQRRHYFHLLCAQDCLDRWLHDEIHPSEGPHEKITFELFWIPISTAISHLFPDHASVLEKLIVDENRTNSENGS
jgi:8-oxo-dGTP pyrophosphatase MutT (NUDIX family)